MHFFFLLIMFYVSSLSPASPLVRSSYPQSLLTGLTSHVFKVAMWKILGNKHTCRRFGFQGGVKKIHLSSEKISQMYLLGVSSIQVGHARCIPQVYPGSLQMYLFAKKNFHGGMVNPVITQPARMSSCLVPSLHFRCPTLYLGFKLLACNPIFLMWPS